MLQSASGLRPPGGLLGRLCICLLVFGVGGGGGVSFHGGWLSAPQPFTHWGDWRKLMAHFQAVSVSLVLSVKLQRDFIDRKQLSLHRHRRSPNKEGHSVVVVKLIGKGGKLIHTLIAKATLPWKQGLGCVLQYLSPPATTGLHYTADNVVIPSRGAHPPSCPL